MRWSDCADIMLSVHREPASDISDIKEIGNPRLRISCRSEIALRANRILYRPPAHMQ